jgi:hypothetical protein
MAIIGRERHSHPTVGVCPAPKGLQKEIVRTSIVLAVGLVLIAVVIGVTLGRSPSTLAGTNGAQTENVLAIAEGAVGACQAGETLPAGTSAIRLSLVAIVGARVAVRVLSGSSPLTSGVTGAGWAGSEVTVAVRPLARTVRDVKVCFGFSDLNGEVEVRGEHTHPSVAAVTGSGQHLRGRIRVEYVRAGHASWLSLLSSIARHMSLGRAASGIWIVFFALALALSVVALTSWGIVRELR